MPGFMHSARIALTVAKRDLVDLWKVKMLFISFLLLPILLMTMFGYMFPPVPKQNQFIGNIPTPYPNLPLSLVVQDHGPIAIDVANRFVETAQTQELFRVSEIQSYEEARNMLVRGETSGIVVIPFGFTADIYAGHQGTVELTVDETNTQIGQQVQSAVSAVFSAIGPQITQSAAKGTLIPRFSGPSAQGTMSTMSNDQINFMIEPVSVTGVPLISGNSNTFEFLAPGFMAMTIVFGALAGVSFSLAREKEQGTLDGLLVAPVSRRAIVLGKILAQTARGLLQGFIVLGLSIAVFGVRVYGDPILMIFVMILAVMSFVGVGIVLTAFAPDQETAQMMIFLLNYPMMFLSGIIFPVTQLPVWLQWVGRAMPLYYATEALRRVVILNAGLSVIWPDVLVLTAYTAATLILSVPIFNKVISK